MELIKKLHEIRRRSGPSVTKGLDDGTIEGFAQRDRDLVNAIDGGYNEFLKLEQEFGDKVKLPELELIKFLQSDFVNFYEAASVNPYTAIHAQGPWVVTAHGAVLHDSGGYGMLGFGHAPQAIIDVMARQHVMANIMTANFSQKRLTDKLKKEIGHTRSNRNGLYQKFLCLNSGSEAVTVAARIADLNAKKLTDPGARYHARKIMMLSLKGSFHGRTERPAMASDSSAKNYLKLASFRQVTLQTVEINNIAELRQAFVDADKNGVYFEMMLMEPVMGEGNPGARVTREFYDEARRLTRAHGALLMMDSIQAGIRTQGVLSICDYPGFETAEVPDMETYSKAVNAGQYPLSILALDDQAAALYETGLYGNTMTTNPRALDVACKVLDLITPDLRKNIRDRGVEILAKFKALQQEFPHAICDATGTGLLCALHLKPEGFKVLGIEGIETWLRYNGIGVIHGGANALRFTPHFKITSLEIDLIIEKVRQGLKRGPVYK